MPPPEPPEPEPGAPIDAARQIAERCRAWKGDDPRDAVFGFGQALERALDPQAGQPLALTLAVRTATAARPDDRYRDPAELARVLDAWAAAELDRPAPPVVPGPRPWLERAAWLVAVPGLVLLVIGLGGVIAGWTPRPGGTSFTVPAEEPP